MVYITRSTLIVSLCLVNQVTGSSMSHKQWKYFLNNTYQKTIVLLQCQDKAAASPHPGPGWLLGMAARDLQVQKPECANAIEQLPHSHEDRHTPSDNLNFS